MSHSTREIPLAKLPSVGKTQLRRRREREVFLRQFSVTCLFWGELVMNPVEPSPTDTKPPSIFHDHSFDRAHAQFANDTVAQLELRRQILVTVRGAILLFGHDRTYSTSAARG